MSDSLLPDDRRPVWLLDFDGVINAISKKGCNAFWDDWNQVRIQNPSNPDNPKDTLPLLWSSTVARTVADAHAAGVRVIWLTTWREHTKVLPDIIPELPRDLPWWDEDVLLGSGGRLDPMNQLGQRWKFDVAHQLVPDGVPLLWTDDTLNFGILRLGNRRWTETREGGTTLINPVEAHGLYRKHIVAIREWIEEVTA